MRHRHEGTYRSLTPKGKLVRKKRPIHNIAGPKKEVCIPKKRARGRPRMIKVKKERFDFSNVMEELR